MSENVRGCPNGENRLNGAQHPFPETRRAVEAARDCESHVPFAGIPQESKALCNSRKILENCVEYVRMFHGPRGEGFLVSTKVTHSHSHWCRDRNATCPQTSAPQSSAPRGGAGGRVARRANAHGVRADDHEQQLHGGHRCGPCLLGAADASQRVGWRPDFGEVEWHRTGSALRHQQSLFALRVRPRYRGGRQRDR